MTAWRDDAGANRQVSFRRRKKLHDVANETLLNGVGIFDTVDRPQLSRMKATNVSRKLDG